MKKNALIYISFIYLVLIFGFCNTPKQDVIETEKNSTVENQVNREESQKATLSLTKLWETPPDFLTPEAVIYDPIHDICYVSNVNQNPADKDENGFISKMSKSGEIIELKWVEGMSAPKGMDLWGEKLYVSDIDRLVEIDIQSGEITNTYLAEGAKFLNDVRVNKDKGIVYVTDSGTATIFALIDVQMTIWLQGEFLNGPNGLLIENEDLLVGCEPILAVDMETKEWKELIPNTGSRTDGLLKVKDGLYIFSHWKGEIFQTDLKSNTEMILNTVEDKKQTADMGFIKDENLLLVPTFFDNKVVAYTVE